MKKLNSCRKVNGSPPAIPRSCTRQTQRDNVPATTPEEYHKRALTIPFLDHMISHIETHFSNLHQKAVMALKIIPSVALQSSETQGNDAHELVNFFINDLPSASTVEQEVELWFSKWKSYEGFTPIYCITKLILQRYNILKTLCAFIIMLTVMMHLSAACVKICNKLMRMRM